MKFDDQTEELIFKEIAYKKILDDSIAHEKKRHRLYEVPSSETKDTVIWLR